jgi:hypothetical protein
LAQITIDELLSSITQPSRLRQEARLVLDVPVQGR